MTDDFGGLDQLWPPFALRVTCGPLVLRPLRDADFPEVLAVVHAGVHAPDLMPFSFPWTDATGADMDKQFVQYHWRARAELAPERWQLDLGVWEDGRFVGVQGVSTRDFPVTRTGETGSWLGQAFHGRGIGTLMRQAICVLCLDHLGFAEVTSGAFADNPASQAVSRKVGYRPNGEERYDRKGAPAIMLRLVLAPGDLVRPPYEVEVVGADAFLDLVQARAT
jgi:RimJ/RimL family protein N-acetyltransferase